MMRYVCLFALLCTALSAAATDWMDGLSELQRFRTFPYVDKAFELERAGQYEAAAQELSKALDVVPAHQPLLRILLNYQLSIPDPGAALLTYQLLDGPMRQDNLLRIAQIQLQLPQPFDLALYARLLPALSSDQQQQLQLLIVQGLIAQQRPQQAYDWLMQQPQLNPQLRLQRAILAELLGQPQQVVADTEALAETDLTDTDWLRYGLALLQLGQGDKAAARADSMAKHSWAAQFYREWLQQQLASADWHGAERSFSWLARQQQLSSNERQQRYQAALNRGDMQQARQLVATLDVSCLQQVNLYLQTGSEAEARQRFLTCPRQQNALWLNYAGRWLDADTLAAARLSDSKLAQQQADIVAQKRIASQDYPALLKQLFAKPLQVKDYPLLVNSINGLNDVALQQRYLAALYQQMPDDYLLERLSYVYLQQQQDENAFVLLHAALPYSDNLLAQGVVPERLLNLLLQHPQWRTETLLAELDSWQHYPQQRAELWRLAGQCQRAEQLLLPTPDSAAAWQTLALCANDNNSAAAVQYWLQAYQLQPEPEFLKQRAYQLARMQQPAQALAQWQALPADSVLPAERLTMAELALQLNDSALAQQYLTDTAPAQADLAGRYFALKAGYYQQLKQNEQAIAAWQNAVQMQPQRADYLLSYAYALVDTAPEQAAQLIRQVQALPDSKPSAALAAQLAYLNQRLARADEALFWSEQALAQYAELAPEQAPDVTIFSLNRLQQQLASPWQFSASISATSGAITGERLVADSQALARYGSVLKVDYFTDRVKRDLMLFALLASNGQDAPFQDWGDQLGVSYRPLAQANLWLTAAIEQYPLFDSNWQPLLRVSADMLNNTPWQADWRPEQFDWQERKLYLDAVWWPKSGNRLAQLRYDQGRVWRLNSNLPQTLKWYGLAQFDYRRQLNNSAQPVSGEQLTVGSGVQWRFWLGQAPVLLRKQRFEVDLEWQYQLAGSLNERQHALLLQFYAYW